MRDLLPPSLTDPQIPRSVLAKLKHWGKMPGSIVTMEAILRVETGSQSIPDVVSTLCEFANALATASLPACDSQPALLSACFSVLVTLGKVLDSTSQVCPPPKVNLPSGRKALSAAAQLSAPAAEAEGRMLASLGLVHRCLFGAIIAMTANVDSFSTNAGSGTRLQRGDRNSTSGGTASAFHHSCSSSDSTSPTARNREKVSHVGHSQESALDSMLQLQVAACQALLRLSLWRRNRAIRAEVYLERELDAQMVEVGEFILQLRLRDATCNGSAVFLASSLPQTATEFRHRFAEGSVLSRPQPGCCNTVCRNLVGVSEAVLPTRLCGGCKRVRYCSVECQQAGWIAGGHESVCGGGGVGVSKLCIS